ncbi:MAG: 30S ribosomal protein S6e [Candidatus Hydrothermarchaeales archaeon]
MKIVLSDPKEKRAYNIELDETKTSLLIGRKVGDKISGKELGLSGYEIKITGGSDRDGTPIKRDVHGAVRRRVLMSKGQGYRQKEEGIIKRKLVRGNVITGDIVQVNAVVVKRGKKTIEKLLSPK